MVPEINFRAVTGSRDLLAEYGKTRIAFTDDAGIDWVVRATKSLESWMLQPPHFEAVTSEDSFLVHDPDPAWLRDAARRFGQNAVFRWTPSVCEVVWTAEVEQA